MLLADGAAAEDAVQQVFAALLRPGADARIESDGAYLRRAVRNACYSQLRRRVVRAEVDDGAPLLETVAGAAVPPDVRLLLERALRELPPEQREVVHLHVFEGLTFKEIASESGTSINTVAARYRYALARMRTMLSQEG
jgi:RNA polymerase sigma-70 factor (ECF subfamily)